MGLPIATLEDATVTLWNFQNSLKVARGKRATQDALEGLTLLAEHSRFPTVRKAAAESIRQHREGLQTAVPALEQKAVTA